MFEKEVTELNSSWTYEYDKEKYGRRDHWKIMKEAPYVGDCEDYALTLLYLISEKSLLKFWWNLLTFKAGLRRVITENGVGHVVLRYGKMYADNWTLAFVPWAEMEKLGHKKNFWFYLPHEVALKMLIAKLLGTKK